MYLKRECLKETQILCFRLYYTVGILVNHVSRWFRAAVRRTVDGGT